MSFYQKYRNWKKLDFENYFEQLTGNDIIEVINKDKLNREDYLKLLSPVAGEYLEEMAQKAHHLTVQNFGRVIFLYAPIYLSNYCSNHCAYCGFNVNNEFERKKLSLKEVEKEAKAVSNRGIKHILLLTGGSRYHSPVSYIKDCVEIVKEYFASIAIEVYALRTEEYQELAETGVDGLTIYQEVYNEKIYDQVHPAGQKKNYKFRLDAPERGCKAGMRNVSIGALLGLDDWRWESFFTGFHAEYLQNKFLEIQVNASVPRLKPHLGNFEPLSHVKDRNLVQIILALRLFLPRLGINISTREGSELRNNLLPLGVTKVSAGSTTVVGGYTSDKGTGQFDIADKRGVEAVKKLLRDKGYQPVFKNWHQI